MSKYDLFQAKNGLSKLPVYVSVDNGDIIKYIEQNRSEIDKQILQFGGLLLRDFSLRSVSEFNKVANILSPQLLTYENRSTPRTNIGGKIYTATEYPANKSIPLHNENSYTLSWPNKIFFFAVIVAATGGETPIADSREVYKKIDPTIIKKFDEKKILYRRNYTTGIDLSWQEVFQSNDKAQVEKYCKENSINYIWHNKNNLELTTDQICQATLSHPTTKELVWFNQAHLFHKSALDKEDLDTLSKLVGENNLPRNTYFGDGSEINLGYLNHIKDVYESEKIEFRWQKGDVMILDNILMAHSRNPFTGERKTVVAMGT